MQQSRHVQQIACRVLAQGGFYLSVFIFIFSSVLFDACIADRWHS
jgi:hypothetical protein